MTPEKPMWKRIQGTTYRRIATKSTKREATTLAKEGRYHGLKIRVIKDKDGQYGLFALGRFE